MEEPYVCVDPVGHELGLSVRWDEGDCPVALEARQTDTLMKLHILHGDSLPFVSCAHTHTHHVNSRTDLILHNTLSELKQLS